MMTATATIAAAATEIGTSAEVGTEMAGVAIGITTVIAGTVTATELAVMRTASRIAESAMDPTTPADSSAMMISRNAAHDGVHRKLILSHRSSPSMFHLLAILPAFSDHHRIQTSHATYQRLRWNPERLHHLQKYLFLDLLLVPSHPQV